MIIERPEQVPPYEPWTDDPAYGKTLNNVCNYVRLLNHLGAIVEAVDGQENIPTSEEFTPHLPTYLKLLLTASYARTFLKVGSRHTDKLYYLDVLSASGLTHPRAAGSPVPGSCFWVPLARQDFTKPRTPPEISFNRVWTFDNGPNCLAALRHRRDRLVKRAGFSLPPFEYVEGDVNQSLRPVLDNLGLERRADMENHRASLVLAFIDNLALDVTMETIERLQATVRADLIVHLPTRAIWRSCQQARKTDADAGRLTRFFGSEEAWQKIDKQEDIPAVYQTCVKAVTREEFQPFEPVAIRGPKHDFALCIYVRKTRGARETGWIDSIQKLAAACNEFDDDKLRRVLSVATGKQRTLDGWSDDPGSERA